MYLKAMTQYDIPGRRGNSSSDSVEAKIICLTIAQVCDARRRTFEASFLQTLVQAFTIHLIKAMPF